MGRTSVPPMARDDAGARGLASKALSRFRSELGINQKATWIPYSGPEGGDGWQNLDTGDVDYSDEPPGQTPDPDDIADEDLMALAEEEGIDAEPDEIRDRLREELAEREDGESGGGEAPQYGDLSDDASQALDEASAEDVREAGESLTGGDWSDIPDDEVREELASSMASESEILDGIGSDVEAVVDQDDLNAAMDAVTNEVRGNTDEIDYGTVSEVLSADDSPVDADSDLVNAVAEEFGVGRGGDGGSGSDRAVSGEDILDADPRNVKPELEDMGFDVEQMHLEAYREEPFLGEGYEDAFADQIQDRLSEDEQAELADRIGVGDGGDGGDGGSGGDVAVDTADLESAARERGYDEVLDAYSDVAGEDAAEEVRAEISEMGGDVNENVAEVLTDRLVDDEASELMDQMGGGSGDGGDGGGDAVRGMNSPEGYPDPDPDGGSWGGDYTGDDLREAGAYSYGEMENAIQGIVGDDAAEAFNEDVLEEANASGMFDVDGAFEFFQITQGNGPEADMARDMAKEVYDGYVDAYAGGGLDENAGPSGPVEGQVEKMRDRYESLRD